MQTAPELATQGGGWGEVVGGVRDSYKRPIVLGLGIGETVADLLKPHITAPLGQRSARYQRKVIKNTNNGKKGQLHGGLQKCGQL